MRTTLYNIAIPTWLSKLRKRLWKRRELARYNLRIPAVAQPLRPAFEEVAARTEARPGRPPTSSDPRTQALRGEIGHLEASEPDAKTALPIFSGFGNPNRVPSLFSNVRIQIVSDWPGRPS